VNPTKTAKRLRVQDVFQKEAEAMMDAPNGWRIAERAEKAEDLRDPFTWEKNRKIITADVHGVPGLANFSYRKNLSSELSPATHFHRGLLEIHYVIKGSRVTNILLPGGAMERYRLTGGEGLLVYPDEPHNNGGVQQSPSEYYALQVDMREQGEILGLDQTYSDLLRQGLNGMPSRHIEVPGRYAALLLHAFGLFSGGDPKRVRMGVQYLTCFLFQLPEMKSAEAGEALRVGNRIWFALRYIEENCMEPIRLERLAREAGYSLSHFKAKFLEEVGTTPANYVNAYKVEKAKELLLTTDEPITDLSYRMGWSSSNHFCTVFKKYAGVSPTQYRKLNRG